MIKILLRRKFPRTKCISFLPLSVTPFIKKVSLHDATPAFNATFMKKQGVKTDATDKSFNEKALMKQFVELWNTQPRDPKAIQEFLKGLESNINSLNNPISLLTLLHRFQLYSRFISPELKNKIFDRTVYVFDNAYDFRDEGELLSKAVLTASLQKAADPGFYKRMFEIIYNNRERMTYGNLITIMESYTYNKRIFEVATEKQFSDLLLTLKSRMKVGELKNLFKCVSLLTYVRKNAQNAQINASFEQQLKFLSTQLIQAVPQIVTETLSSNQKKSGSPTLDLFTLAQLLITLRTAENVFPELKPQNDQIERYIPTLFDTKGYPKEDLIAVDFTSLVEFVRSYHVIPPQNLNKTVAEYISRFFMSNLDNQFFGSLDNITMFLLFLIKTKSYNLDAAATKRIEDQIVQQIESENNLATLTKVLEFYSLSYNNPTSPFKSTEKVLDLLSEKLSTIVIRMGDKLTISASLLQAFQLLVYVNRGSNELWQRLFTIFGKIENLERLDHLELLIKLIPAAARKTRGIYRVFTNINSAKFQQEGPVDKNLETAVYSFWNSIEQFLLKRQKSIHPEKMPQILFHFVYANIGEAKYRKLYPAFKDTILKNLQRLSPKELSEVLYAYSRVQERDDELCFTIAERIHNNNLYQKMNEIELANAYWGISQAGFFQPEFGERAKNILLDRLDNISDETFVEFCQALALNNPKLSDIQNINLNKKLMSRLHNQNKDSGALTIGNTLGMAYSFLVLHIHSPTVWNTIVDIILKNARLIEKNESWLHYTYLIYVHLHIEKVPLERKGELLKFIQKNYNTIVNYFSGTKTLQSSKFEDRIRKMIVSNADSFAVPLRKLEDDEFRTLRVDDIEGNFLLLADISKVKQVVEKHNIDLSSQNLLAPYTIDILTDKVAIEVNGPWHYLRNKQGVSVPHGINDLKLKFFERMKLKVVDVPYFELNNNDKTDFEIVKNKVNSALSK